MPALTHHPARATHSVYAQGYMRERGVGSSAECCDGALQPAAKQCTVLMQQVWKLSSSMNAHNDHEETDGDAGGSGLTLLLKEAGGAREPDYLELRA